MEISTPTQNTGIFQIRYFRLCTGVSYWTWRQFTAYAYLVAKQVTSLLYVINLCCTERHFTHLLQQPYLFTHPF